MASHPARCSYLERESEGARPKKRELHELPYTGIIKSDYSSRLGSDKKRISECALNLAFQTVLIACFCFYRWRGRYANLFKKPKIKIHFPLVIKEQFIIEVLMLRNCIVVLSDAEEEEKNIGVTVVSYLKPSQQCKKPIAEGWNPILLWKSRINRLPSAGSDTKSLLLS